MFSLVGTLKPFTMAHSELKAYIESKPHITDVWLAEDGGWYFVEMPNTKKVSREDLLGANTTSEEAPAPKPQKQTKK